VRLTVRQGSLSKGLRKQQGAGDLWLAACRLLLGGGGGGNVAEGEEAIGANEARDASGELLGLAKLPKKSFR
jgi:hypothetical protein